MAADFFESASDLVRRSDIIIDRPAGQPHLKTPEAIYPINYGYLADTTGGDGAGIDVFVGSAAGTGVIGVALTVDLVKRDAEVKLLLDRTPAETRRVESFLRDDLGIGGTVLHRTP